MIDFSLPPALADRQARVRHFVTEQGIPLEGDPRQDAHGPDEPLGAELIGRARRAALLSPGTNKAVPRGGCVMAPPAAPDPEPT